MATIPPGRKIHERVQTIAESVMSWATAKKPQLAEWDKLEKTTAVWLRSNSLALDTLTRLIEARREARAMAPVPGTPHDLAIHEGRNREGQDIIRLLRKIYAAPLEFGAEDETND